MNRRLFIENSTKVGLGLALLGLISCDKNKKKATDKIDLFFRLSLAQWSFHKTILRGKLDPLDFVMKAKQMEFEGVEYVSHLHLKFLESFSSKEAGVKALTKEWKKRSEDLGMKNLLIMVDGEGDLAVTDVAKRDKAVENHYKWIDAATEIGASAIRINLFGEKNPTLWQETSTDTLFKLTEYSKKQDIRILVENHGCLSSNAKLLIEVMDMVQGKNENELAYVGTLPDFGNFCLKREGGKRWGTNCLEEYDKYMGIKELCQYAYAMSAKSYDFDSRGDETTIDYYKMLQIIKDNGYRGFIGVEYEGNRLSEEEGILKTKELLIRAMQKLK